MKAYVHKKYFNNNTYNDPLDNTKTANNSNVYQQANVKTHLLSNKKKSNTNACNNSDGSHTKKP